VLFAIRSPEWQITRESGMQNTSKQDQIWAVLPEKCNSMESFAEAIIIIFALRKLLSINQLANCVNIITH